METSTLKLLTIVADEALTHVLEEALLSFGATGYTLTAVSGKGKSGVRDSAWEGENVKIEAIVNDDVLHKVLHHLREHFLDKYALVTYYTDVRVLRPGHFQQ